jgi:hypothetical protein
MDGLRRTARGRGTFARVDERGVRDGEAGEETTALLRWTSRVLVAEVSGFNLHAGVRVAADDRDGLERLCRYLARPTSSRATATRRRRWSRRSSTASGLSCRGRDPRARLVLRGALPVDGEVRPRAQAGDLPPRGVGHVWLVSTVMQTVGVLRRLDIGWGLVATFEGDAVVRAEPFDAVPLDLAGLWSV